MLFFASLSFAACIFPCFFFAFPLWDMLGIKYPDAVARAVYPFKYLRRVDRIAKCIVKRQFFLYAKHSRLRGQPPG